MTKYSRVILLLIYKSLVYIMKKKYEKGRWGMVGGERAVEEGSFAWLGCVLVEGFGCRSR